jgi:phage I-like protein
MSEPIRYRPDWTYTGTAFVPFCRQQDNGEFVRYEDYARLKAEVKSLTYKIRVSDNNAQCLEEVINAGTANERRLKAEVERLTAFTTRTIIPNEELQAQIEQLQNRCDFLEGNQP